MAGRTIQVTPRIRMVLNNEGFKEVRKLAVLEAKFHKMGSEWVDRLNAELHAAQTSRQQPVEDGYDYHVHNEGTRIRMYVVAVTARARAHENEHSSILKLMRTSGFDVETHSTETQAKMDKARARRRRAAFRARLATDD
jgi:geranylgeranyl pyrophosphate synthase